MIVEWKISIFDWLIKLTLRYYYTSLNCFAILINKRRKGNDFCKGSFWSWFSFISLLWTTFLWIFSFDLDVVYCWLICSYLSDMRSLIPILFFGCDRKFSVGRIQNIHMYLLPPQAWGSSWKEWLLFFHPCWHQLIVLIN